MPSTITYEYIDNCAGGGHFRVDVSLNASGKRRFVYTTDEMRETVADLDLDEQALVARVILRLHMAGQTRQQMLAEFQAGPVTVTV